ncbi:hematopoietic progenitor cell antigen CD34 [Notolabrus celidotus]|uniref:hematopoietic progenitor cell antigen CD34 n=1 Tax=Notolabrus celidotus TaxID=1203425 RepID=UPI00148FB4CE|nr:hematopoietic progenitor cell antigen CD34 [Notolabrus celidotus]
MATSSAQRTDALCKMLALAVLLIAPLFNGVVTQEDEVVTGTTPAVVAEEMHVRGDMIPMTTPTPVLEEDPQVIVLPTMGSPDLIDQTTAAADTDATGDDNNSSPVDPEKVLADEGTEVTPSVQTNAPKVEPETQPPMPPRGDGPDNVPIVPVPIPKDDVTCVSKEAVQDKNAVNLKLKAASTCEQTRVKIESVLQELCGEDCKLEIYQEDNTDEIIVAGKYVEDDVAGMANKFNNDNIKDMTDVEEAAPRWGKNSKLVLVSLLLTGLLLAALLVAGYYLKTHRKNSKGVRLADTFQVDEENQANTLVSVAPLPQDPLDKPTTNGESPPENGNNPAPTTNGHSATQTPVADTEM